MVNALSSINIENSKKHFEFGKNGMERDFEFDCMVFFL